MKLEGYAIDCGHAITGVEFSLDDGEHWTLYETPGTNDYQRVSWQFSFVPERPGSYGLKVRSINDEGKPSPRCDYLEIRAR